MLMKSSNGSVQTAGNKPTRENKSSKKLGKSSLLSKADGNTSVNSFSNAQSVPGGVVRSTGKGSYFDDYLHLTQTKGHYYDPNSFNIWAYLRTEMFGIGEPGNLEPPSKEHIQNFFLVPINLESLIFLGFFISLDAFLYVITYLPIRVVFSLYLLIARIHAAVTKSLLNTVFGSTKSTPGEGDNRSRPPLGFHRTHMYDLMRGAMFIVGCMVLRQISMSEVYHFIRGQSMIKLYVLTSMLEIFDKLLSSFGQDAFDALHWNTRYQPRSYKMIITFLMVTGYVCIHSAIYFLHVATMTVVINSVDKALITVLILNNFTEMKVFILKKFDCNNLFQLACSDITERFQMFLFLFLIFLVALGQAGDSWVETLQLFARIAVMMLVGECVADWMKHAFINKFNFINASVYQDFAYVLRGDILTNQKDEIILDHTYSVTRRLGLSQIPLGCVCIRYLMLAVATPVVQMYIYQLSMRGLIFQIAALFVSLVALKVVIGIGLVFYSSGAHRRDASIFMRSPAVVRPPKINTAQPFVGGGTPGIGESNIVTPRRVAEAITARSANSNNFLHQHSNSQHFHDRTNQSRSNSITNHFSDLHDTISAASSPVPKRRLDANRLSPPDSPMSAKRDSCRNLNKNVDQNLDKPKETPRMSRSLSDAGTTAAQSTSSIHHSNSGGIALDESNTQEYSPTVDMRSFTESTGELNLTDRRKGSSIDLNDVEPVKRIEENADVGDGFLNAHLAAVDPSLKERLDLLEELSSMERYTVYKGRII